MGDISPEVLKYANALRDVLVLLKKTAREESSDKRESFIVAAEKIAQNAGLGPIVQRVKSDDTILEAAIEIIAEGGDMIGWSTNVHETDDGFCDGIVIGSPDYVEKLLTAFTMLVEQPEDEEPNDQETEDLNYLGSSDDGNDLLPESPEIGILTESSDSVIDDDEDEFDDGGLPPDSDMLN